MGVIWDGFGCPEASLCGFGGSWKQVGILMYLGTSPGRPKAEGIQKWVVKNLIPGPRRQTKSRTPASFGLVFRLQAQDCKLTKGFRLQAHDTRLLIQDCIEASQPGGP